MLSLTNEETGKSGGITLGSVNNEPVKELTDEEILDIWTPFDLSGDAWVYDDMLIGFARAILRKAQGD